MSQCLRCELVRCSRAIDRGLDMAVEEHFGATPAWSCDNDPDASRLLAHHWPAVPNLGDITAVDWSAVEPVEILTGGWPCQPWSVAGKRKGKADARALWPEVERAVRALRPRLVVLENVPNIVPLGELARAVGDLAALGYVGSWLRVGAHEVGAPHQRRRIFIAASDTTRPGLEGRRQGRPGRGADAAEDADGAARGERRIPASGQAEGRWPRPDAGRRSGVPAADADRDGGRLQPVAEPGGGGSAVAVDAGPGLAAADATSDSRRILDGDRAAVADATSDGRHEGRPEPTRQLRRPDAAVGGPIDWGSYRPAIERWERILGRPAPAPTVDGPRGGRRLNPELPEWMMGLPLGHITAVPGLTRNAMLRLAGNGVVPQQALLALSLLAPVEVAA